MTDVDRILAAAARRVRAGAPLEPVREALAAWLEEKAGLAAIRVRIWEACEQDVAESAESAFRCPLAVARALPEDGAS